LTNEMADLLKTGHFRYLPIRDVFSPVPVNGAERQLAIQSPPD